MPKTNLPYDPSDYALVAERISMFYERFPNGRIVTRLVSRDRDVLFRASVYRDEDDRVPAATGWASEREGDGDVNLVACVENTETSAIGRALANLGFTASRKRPSREEMFKAERARRTISRVAEARNRGESRAAATAAAQPRKPAANKEPIGDGPTASTEAIADVRELLAQAEALGLAAERAATIRKLLGGDTLTAAAAERLESGLRSWLERRSQTPAV